MPLSLRATTVLLGPEYDEETRRTLATALQRVGARRVWGWRGMAGSQEVDRSWYLVGWRLLRISEETYLGATLRGPSALVERIAANMRAAAT